MQIEIDFNDALFECRFIYARIFKNFVKYADCVFKSVKHTILFSIQNNLESTRCSYYAWISAKY